jgi:hypothetical protein
MHRSLRPLATILFTLAVGACGGRIAADDDDDADARPRPSTTTTTSPTTDVPTTTPTTTPTVPKDTVWCGMPIGASFPYANADDLRKLLVGKWLYCDGDGRVGPADVVGFEIRADSHWSYLRRGTDGELVRATAAGYGGWCVVLDLGHGRYQVDLDLDTKGGALITETEFTDGPRRVHLHHRDGYAAYLRVPD